MKPGRHPRPRADGHRRGGRRRGDATQPSATGSSSRSTSPAGTAGCATRQLFAQCETTQVREQGKGAALFGYTSLYGSVPGGQAEYLRVPQAQFGPIKVPDDRRRRAVPVPLRHPAHRLAGRRVRRRPAGRHARRVRARPGRAVRRPDRPAPRRGPGDRGRPGARAAGDGRAGTASRRSTSASVDDVPGALIDLVDGRGPDAVIDAVGMEAHGSPRGEAGPDRRRAAAGRWPRR